MYKKKKQNKLAFSFFPNHRHILKPTKYLFKEGSCSFHCEVFSKEENISRENSMSMSRNLFLDLANDNLIIKYVLFVCDLYLYFLCCYCISALKNFSQKGEDAHEMLNWPNQVQNPVVPDTTYGLHINFPTYFQKQITKLIIIMTGMMAPSLSIISLNYHLRILVALSNKIHLCNTILLLGAVYNLLCDYNHRFHRYVHHLYMVRHLYICRPFLRRQILPHYCFPIWYLTPNEIFYLQSPPLVARGVFH